MRHWKGWADAKTLNQSKHTPSSFETYEASSWNWYHPWLKSQGVLMVMHDEFKYQPCPTIHYTHNEMLEGSSWCELPESVQSHTILVWSVGVCQAKSVPAHDSKLDCGDHFRAHVPISTLHNHSSYYRWDTGRVELMQRPWINPNIHHLGLKRMRPRAEIDTTRDSKVRVWWWLCMMNSNINHVQLFIIHIMRCWKGQVGVNCLNQSKEVT